MKWIKALAALALYSLPLLAHSIEFEDAVFPELATSGRALALGNAFICKVDDSSAVFYNPAGLGTVRYGHFHLSNFHLESNKGWVNASSGGDATDAAGNFFKGFSTDGTRQILKDKQGLLSHAKFHVMPNFLTRYFSLGFLFSRQLRALHNTDGEFEFAKREDQGPYAALNLSLFGGIIKIGGSGILLIRSEIQDERPINDTIELTDADMKKGTMPLYTFGGRLTLPWKWLPTFAVVIHNVADAEFSKTNGSAGAPTKIKQTMDLGVSVTPQIGRATRVHMEVNYKDFGGAYSNVSMTRKIVFGIELDFSRRMFMRAGYGDGFGSGGIGIRSKKLEFDLTSYAVDTTGSKFRGQEDRRFAMTLSSGF